MCMKYPQPRQRSAHPYGEGSDEFIRRWIVLLFGSSFGPLFSRSEGEREGEGKGYELKYLRVEEGDG
jgi:hypothetical protein